MKTKIIILTFFCLIFFACYMNYSQRIVYYPQPPDQIFDECASALQDLGYTITINMKAPEPFVSKNPYLIGQKKIDAKEPVEAMLTFIWQPQETSIEIHVSRIGAEIDNKILDKLRDEIAQKLEARLKK